MASALQGFRVGSAAIAITTRVGTDRKGSQLVFKSITCFLQAAW